MFDEQIAALGRSRERFAQAIQDSFGRSVKTDIYDPLNGALNRMQETWEQGDLSRRQVQALTLELRMIII